MVYLGCKFLNVKCTLFTFQYNGQTIVQVNLPEFTVPTGLANRNHRKFNNLLQRGYGTLHSSNASLALLQPPRYNKPFRLNRSTFHQATSSSFPLPLPPGHRDTAQWRQPGEKLCNW